MLGHERHVVPAVDLRQVAQLGAGETRLGSGGTDAARSSLRGCAARPRAGGCRQADRPEQDRSTVRKPIHHKESVPLRAGLVCARTTCRASRAAAARAGPGSPRPRRLPGRAPVARPTPRTPWRAIRTARLSPNASTVTCAMACEPDGACAAVGTGPPATSSSSSVPVSSGSPRNPGGRVRTLWGVDDGEDVRPPGIDGEVHQALARGLTPACGDLAAERQGDQIVLGHLVVGQGARRIEVAVARADVARGPDHQPGAQHRAGGVEHLGARLGARPQRAPGPGAGRSASDGTGDGLQVGRLERADLGEHRRDELGGVHRTPG